MISLILMISIFDLFAIGIGPSSSHTVGPMKASLNFLKILENQEQLSSITRIKVELFGSLALTGDGHGTKKAILAGLKGHNPATIDPANMDKILHNVYTYEKIFLLGIHEISFHEKEDLILNNHKRLKYHPNGIIFQAFKNKKLIIEREYYSIGGGFIEDQDSIKNKNKKNDIKVPYNFNTSSELLALATKNNLTIKDLVYQNELCFHTQEEINNIILQIWTIMQQSVILGCSSSGILPGGLQVKRRAPDLYHKLTLDSANYQQDPTSVMDWVSLFALAVSEQNASGGRVVTAPTNGASGVIPAVLHYYQKYYHNLSIEELKTFFFTAGAIGVLCKEGASISGAEVGCQGEIGVASSMASAGLTALRGGTLLQIENSAEIALEHHLGLTCDPVKGLVQIPCIERNTMGAIKAINATRLALRNNGSHIITLDKVIKTMKQTGLDMKSGYKETSTAGLACD